MKNKSRNTSSKMNMYLSATQTAEILGISVATVRNWVKLGKLIVLTKKPLSFDKKYIFKIHEELENSELLKSRRNKTRSSENFIPKNYISTASPNYLAIKKILDDVAENHTDISRIIIGYSKKFLEARGIPEKIADELISANTYKSLSQKPPESDDRTCREHVSENFSKALSLISMNNLQYLPGEDTLGMLYLSLRRLKDKKTTGAYYTPYYVVDRLIENLFKSTECCVSNQEPGLKNGTGPDFSIFDPACGTGNFLLRLPDSIPLESIHGSDIDEMAVFIARVNLALKYGIKTHKELRILLKNLKASNFLSHKTTFPYEEKYDIILGNPPWGYVFSRDELSNISGHFESYNNEKNPESFALFVERAVESLNDSGILSFLLPESILSADTHKGIRRFILKKTRITAISFLGEVFHKVQCPSVILTMRHNGAERTSSNNNELVPQKKEAATEEALNIFEFKSEKNTLNKIRHFTRRDYPISENSFLVLADEHEQTIIDKIRSAPHFTLEGQAEFALGIVTGSNKALLKDAPGDGLEPIIKGKDIEKFCALPATNYVHFEPKAFQQCAPERFYRAGKKLFYRFIADEPLVALDTKGTLSLNSANIMIPNVPGYSAEYIMAILNSDVMSFYYKKTYKSLKVLRSYLEHLPIACCSQKDQEEIIKLSIKLSEAGTLRLDQQRLQNQLNTKIANLYGIYNL